jgi:uncharacterized membrane protein (UPF0127 family)
MQSSETEKIKLGRSHKAGLILLAIIAVAIAWWLKTNPVQSTGHITLSTKAGAYQLEPANTDNERRQGLSNRQSMAQRDGMLFMFDAYEEQCIWMKNMQFPLDIVWVDASLKVTAVRSHVQPSTYPDAFCMDAQYVIELNAGQAAKAGITTGQHLTF